MKVLIVDDEIDVQFLFQQRFRREIRAGLLELLFALSGEAALDYLEQHGTRNLDRILSDINMPGMNGLELLKRIKERYGHLKVCMITAYGDERNYQTAFEYGCEDYFTKPIDFEGLKKKLFEEA
ncbi:Fis family transcriptional regulator [candidate division KSB1 bacterium RBG_16_48_16]|nr:MAG: Fis family transcriptional regulator [candidate division KSB1 bacterium RBG_16_48_16]